MGRCSHRSSKIEVVHWTHLVHSDVPDLAQEQNVAEDDKFVTESVTLSLSLLSRGKVRRAPYPRVAHVPTDATKTAGAPSLGPRTHPLGYVPRQEGDVISTSWKLKSTNESLGRISDIKII